MTRLQVVDPHIHFWELESGLYPNLVQAALEPDNGMYAVAYSYRADDLLADAGDIEILKVVHVEGIATDGLAEARHVQAMMGSDGILAGIVAHADLGTRDVRGDLEKLSDCNGVRGIRQILNLHDNPDFTYGTIDHMARPAWRDGLALLPEFGFSFDMQLYPHQMLQALEIIRAQPNLMFILNHAGMFVDRDLAGWKQWRSGIAELAKCDNVVVKISGLSSFDSNWTVESIRPYVFEVLEQFGLERSMFASNFPVDKRFSDYQTVWRGFEAITAGFSADERAGLFVNNALRLYRL